PSPRCLSFPLHVALPIYAQFGLQALFNWLSGGVSATSWPPIFVVGTIILVGIAFSLILSRSLDAFALGEEGAAHLGLNVERRKRSEEHTSELQSRAHLIC